MYLLEMGKTKKKINKTKTMKTKVIKVNEGFPKQFIFWPLRSYGKNMSKDLFLEEL